MVKATKAKLITTDASIISIILENCPESNIIEELDENRIILTLDSQPIIDKTKSILENFDKKEKEK